MAYQIQKAIELGKIWMRNSVDPSHDFEHAQNVSKHALEIFKELEPNDITTEMVEIACWWHDSYKSRCKHTTWHSIYYEGGESKKIFEKEVGQLLPSEYVERIGEAIYNHNRAFHILFNHRKLDSLSMILIEADQIEGLNTERDMKSWKHITNPVIRILDMMLTMVVPIFLRIIMKSEYTKRIIKLRNKRG